jgi:hypothetical protein
MQSDQQHREPKFSDLTDRSLVTYYTQAQAQYFTT